MKIRSYVLALVIAAPAIAWSQGGAKPAGPDMKASFDKMQSNVTQISGPLEKERWQANIALWKVKLDCLGKLDKAELDLMRPHFEIMKANVAKITVAAEKERWQANRELWEMVLGQTTDKFSTADMAKIKAAFDKMQANVVLISGVSEKGRWQANRDLWRDLIAQM